MKRLLLGFIIPLFLIQNLFGAVPVTFTNGTAADATEVNSNFAYFETKFSTTSGHDHDNSDSKLITITGTVTSGEWRGTVVDTPYGGTNLSSYATGDLIAATSDTVLSRIATADTGNVLLSNGAFLPFWGKVDLGVHTSGSIDLLLPSQIGNSGKFLTTDGLVSSWGNLNKQVFTSNGNFTAPASITQVYLSGCGGGGGGGGVTGASTGGGGGASGGMLIKYPYTVTPTSVYAVAIGALGAGGAAGDNNGASGGNTTFDSSVTATGGTGGSKGTVRTAGTSPGNALNANGQTAGNYIYGGSGADGQNTSPGVGGGGGGCFFGAGGAGGNTSTAGSDGSGYCSGGGGGGSGAIRAGGSGAAGILIVEW